MSEQGAAFHNRTRELRVLADALGSDRGELVIIYGRRGVGKTALLREAVRSQAGAVVFYRATRRALPMQLAGMSEVIAAAFPGEFIAQPFAATALALDFIAHQARARLAVGDGSPVVLVIDELPYLAAEDHGLLTVLQHWWDDNKRLSNLKVLLAGSVVSFMERQVLDVNGPLYNRRTAAMKLEPLDYAEAGLFFGQYGHEDRMRAYGLLGGMPSYLEQFDPARSIAENAMATVLRNNTYLSEEPDWLLMEGLRRDAVYGSILRSVAQGARRPSDIARDIGRRTAQDVSANLATLIDLGLVVREVPVTENRAPRSRNSLYYVADQYLDFWFRYVDPARALVERGLGRDLWSRTIGPALDVHVSRPTFERAARQYLWRARAAGVLPDDWDFVDVGAWWGPPDIEIDVAATDAAGRVTAVGSCKWTAHAMDVGDYAALQNSAALAGFALGPLRIVLFSRSGFSAHLAGIARAAGPDRLRLVDLPSMYQV